MNIGEKLTALMDLCGFDTLEAVAIAVRRAGAPAVKYQHLQQLLKFPNRQPRYLVQLAHVFGMTVEQFLAWKPGMPLPKLYEAATRTTPASSEMPDDEWADILGRSIRSSLGDGLTIDDYAETHRLKFRAESLRRKRLKPDRLAVCYGKGDSMEPRIRDGDAIMYDTSDREPKDGKLYVVVYDNKLLTKQLSNFDGVWFLESLNKASREWRKPVRVDRQKGLEIQGRVRWIGSWED